ncbi:MAG: transcriptional regulator [Schwartzia sp.]|nr:transcriptional regulator [Schwartzia sp. (in: firmicutes)]
MTHAYPRDYLYHVQKNLGDFFDFAVNTCGKPLEEAFHIFIQSGAARLIEKGHPLYLVGMTGCELFRWACEKMQIPIPDVEDAMYTDRSAEYWIGWAIAYYQWQRGYSFQEITDAVPPQRLERMYSIYHEMDLEQFIDAVDQARVQTNHEMRAKPSKKAILSR